MSEADAPAQIPPFAFHRRTKRRPEDVAIAFLDTFSGMSGRVVLEELFNFVCMAQVPPGQEVRAEGMKDLWLYIVDLMAQGEAIKQRGEGWVTHEHERASQPQT